MRTKTKSRPAVSLLLASVSAYAMSASAVAQPLADVDCAAPPVARCGEACEPQLLGELGNATEPRTGRAFFLDYPCDLEAGEPVLFILSLHGAGSIGNWQRHYFPAVDYLSDFRLVVATPTAMGSGEIGERTVRMWQAEADDTYLRSIVDLVIERFGAANIRAFWLAGHSQGGLTANRLVCSDYFRDKVDGWLSLSGGRVGRAEIVPDFFGPAGPPPALDSDGARPGAAATPGCDISFIFTSGEHEIVALPETSPLAERYGCGPRVRDQDIIDTQKGYVTGAAPGWGASWGREARPGTAELYVYPDCTNGRVVADVLRLDKGHTEGIEPRVTVALLELMAGAPGGRLAGQR